MGKAKSRFSFRVAWLLILAMGLSLLSAWAAPVGRAARAHGLQLDLPVRELKAPPAPDPLGYVPGELLVKLDGSVSIRQEGGKLSASSAALSDLIACYGFTSANQVAPGTYKLNAPSSAGVDLSAAARALEAAGAVSYAGPNHLFHVTNSPNDEQYVNHQQWGVTQVKAEQAWDVTTGSDSIVIAILDTGTAGNHPDLEGKVLPGWNALCSCDNSSDDHGHGTYTAGIAAAASNNGQGVVGMSWGAKVLPVKVLSGSGSGSEEGIARGIRWAVDNGARIISASLGGDINTPVMQDAVNYAHDRNVLFVAAAGNNPDGRPNYPAGYDTVLAVGATGPSDTVTGFSSYGPYVDVSAPGVGILSTSWDNGTLDYEYGNGTSASTPFVSGAAALVWTVNPQLTADQVKQILEDSSDDVGDPGWDDHSGWGRLNAFKAVQMAQQGAPPPRTATPVTNPTATPKPAATQGAKQPPSLQVNSSNVAPGSLLSITGAGFGVNEFIDLQVAAPGGAPNSIGNAQTNGAGAFRADVGLPKDLPSGKLTLTATGSSSKLHASVELTVSGGGGPAGGNGGLSVIKGTVKAGPQVAAAQISLKTIQGPIGPDLTTQPDANGSFQFTNIAAGLYSLYSQMPGYLNSGPHSVQVNGSQNDSKTVLVIMSATRPPALDPVAAISNTKDQVYFQKVGHTLKGPFLKFWQSHGGLPIFGYPISEPFPEVSLTDGQTYTVQYFERNRFEYHPEFANTPNEVLMGLLGVDSTRGRTFAPGAPIATDTTHAYFPQTQHTLSGPFLQYWKSHGGLAIFGYPISEPAIENGYTVQYFERNRFEYHPEFANTPNEVLLGLLGVETAKRNGWIVQ
ncbi:MAG: S8 family serine peptidase [Chloroflexia bacterium]